MKKLLLILLLFSKTSLANDFVALSKKALPTSVSITAKVDNKEIIGSGFIIDETGLILTNNHVVDNAYHIEVLVNDKQSFKAEIKGQDQVLDIALIKINAFELLPYASFANSDKIEVGQPIMAVGNPFGLGNSVSTGIVSAKKRSLNSSPYDDYIQTDASINIGNSGGPLFDIKGNVVGMVTAMFSQNIKSSGVGFAIPSNQLKWAVDELKKHGKIKRGWIGLSIIPLEKEIKISEVIINSPVHKAGLLVGDKILKINNKDIKNPQNLSSIIASTPIGKKIKIQTNKGVFDVKVVEKPAENNNKKPQTCYALDMEIKEKSLEVINITNNSDAFIKGLKQGDVIKAFDNNDMYNCQDIASYLLEAKRINKQNIMAKIITKDGNTHFVELKI